MYSDLSANIHQDAIISEVDIMIKSKKKMNISRMVRSFTMKYKKFSNCALKNIFSEVIIAEVRC